MVEPWRRTASNFAVMAMRSARSGGVVAAMGRRPVCTRTAPMPTASTSTATIPSRNFTSDLQDVHQLLDRGRGLVERGPLGVGELDLPDLLDALGPELRGHPHVQAVDAELAFQVAAGGQDLVLVLQDGVHHLRGGGRRRV